MLNKAFENNNITTVFYKPDFEDTTLLPLDRKNIVHAKSMDKYFATNHRKEAHR